MLSVPVFRAAAACVICAAVSGCSRAHDEQPAAVAARNLVVITIDTLRADRVGAYGYGAARTPAMDALARRGARFDRAFATAPITLTSHASLFSGRYPPGHKARDNGLRVDDRSPLVAEALSAAGFTTGAFVAAFPLDRRFGLARGFGTYSDRLPRQPDGRPSNERAGRIVVDEALQWLERRRASRFFLWIHLFEPHTPYGNPSDPAAARRPAEARYDDEIAEADRQVQRVLEALGAEAASTIVVVASDHGEAFGEHGEIGHSVFVYDTTLRVPLILAGPGIPEGRSIADPVALIDVAPTVLGMLRVGGFDADGIDLAPALDGRALPRRELYAETFAPLLDFGWSSLRSVRADGWKYIAAPRRELYQVSQDPAEERNAVESDAARAAALAERVDRYSASELPALSERSESKGPAAAPQDAEAAARLRALGYASGSRRAAGGARVDPKDRRELAARIARVASGELRGAPLEAELARILAEDPGNQQANLRLGYVMAESNRCARAAGHFQSAIAAQLPGAEAHLGLAGCAARAGRFDEAAKILREAQRAEPESPLVAANLAVVLSDGGNPGGALPHFERALKIDPDFHQARFNLAVAYGRLGRRAEAAAEATDLLRRLPPNAPQRREVERLLAAVR
jgi:choline-sulfatase